MRPFTSLCRRALLCALFGLCLTACGLPGNAAPTPSPAPTTRPAPTATPVRTPTPAPTPTPPPVAVTYDGHTCPFKLAKGQTEGKDVTCGYLTVPEEHGKNTGRSIRLAVAILKSTGALPDAPPLVYLQGGPGGGVGPIIRAFADKTFAARELLQSHTIIIFDQRGVGHSDPALDCPEMDAASNQDLAQSSNLDEQTQRDVAAAIGCRDRLAGQGINLAAYTSAENAADIHDLKTVLKYDTLDVYGVSYGTRLALTYMRDFPKDIRSVILDSTVPLQADVTADISVSYDRALDALFQACAAEAACNRNYPAIRTTFQRAIQQLDATPYPVQLRDPYSGYTYNTAISGVFLAQQVFSFMYDATAVSYMPALISAIQKGNYDLLLRLLNGGGGDGDPDPADGDSTGMYYSVQCGETIGFSSFAKTTAAAKNLLTEVRTDFTPTQQVLFAVCKQWPAKKAAPIEDQPVNSDIPTLVMQGEFDPITPPTYGKTASATLSKSQFVYFKGIGHGVLTFGPTAACAATIVRQFETDPAKKLDSGCTAPLKLTFATPADVAKVLAG